MNGNGTTDATQQPASFLDRFAVGKDPAEQIRGARFAPNFGEFPIPHVVTFRGLVGAFAKTYRNPDEAIKDSLDNARYARNDCGIMECIEARQRCTALLPWRIEPEDEDSADAKALADEMTKVVGRIRRFTEYRRCLMEAIWYGRAAVQQRFGWLPIGGKRRCLPLPETGQEHPGWLPINGDKLVFRYDDGTTDFSKGAVGILSGAMGLGTDRFRQTWSVETTQQGLAAFVPPWLRPTLVIHKHMIEDGAWESPFDAGTIHGVGIRSRIYWEWFQKQECLAFLMEYLERSAGGVEVWEYPAGNAEAKAQVEKAARDRVANGKGVILFPKISGPDGEQYNVHIVEPGMAGIDVLMNLLSNYFGHRIKRYILGQTLTSEADATGLGSGLADLHLDTFMQIVRYDAGNLAETLTHELLPALQRFNFPGSAGIHLRFKIDVESPDVDKKLEAWSKAWEMGARLKERDVMDLIGAAIPADGDRVLERPDAGGAPGMDGPGGPGGPDGGVGPEGPVPGGRRSSGVVPADIGGDGADLTGALEAAFRQAEMTDALDEALAERYAAAGWRDQYARKKASDPAQGEFQWVTINGTHVKIDSEGTVQSGPDALRGKSLGDGAKAGKSAEVGTKSAPSPQKSAPVLSAVHRAVADRFGIPPEVVANVLATHPDELKRRDEYVPPNNTTEPTLDYEKHPLHAVKMASWSEPMNAPLSWRVDMDPHELEPTESEEGIRGTKTFQDYVKWYRQGLVPPPVEVGHTDDRSKVLSSNRRRVLAAREAGVKSIPTWFDTVNPETGNRLKYGDIIKAAKEADASAPDDAPFSLTREPVRSWKSAEFDSQGGKQQPLFIGKDDEPGQGYLFGSVTSTREGLDRGLYAKPTAGARSFAWNEEDHPRGDDGRFVATEEEVAAHGEYEQAMRKHGIEPRALQAWVEHRREVQGRQGKGGGSEAAKPPAAVPSVQKTPEPDDEPAASEPEVTAPAAFAEAVDRGETPREAAAEAERYDADYEFARKSAVRNVGEDLKGSARHKVNAWRGLAEAEKDGTAEQFVTREMLLKVEPHKLMDATEKHPETALAMHLALKAMPPKPGYGSRPADAKTQAKDRADYLEAYRTIKGHAEYLAATVPDATTALSHMKMQVGAMILALRAKPLDPSRADGPKDRFNNTANALTTLHKKLATGRWGVPSTAVAKQVEEFSQGVRSKYEGQPANVVRGKTIEHVGDVMEGRTVGSLFGTGGTKERPGYFSPADLYVSHATRVGGPNVSAESSDPNRATKWMADRLGFRGVQWGNSVTDDERRHHARHATEALADLVDVLGIAPEDVSLGRTLGLAIGARGHGTASAHYEPGTKVVNLTRKSGVGALAHEWAHGLDHYLAGGGLSTDGRHGVYESERISPRRSERVPGVDRHDPGAYRHIDRSEEPLFQAYQGWRDAVRSSGFRRRLSSTVSEMVRSGQMSKGKMAYWTSHAEVFARSFERYVQRKLHKAGRENTYLTGLANHHGLWPNDEEVDAMAPHFEAIIEQYRRKTGTKVEKLSRREVLAALNAAMRERYEMAPATQAPERSAGQPAKRSRGGKGGAWKKVGGSSVFVGPDGTIKKGCPGLKGENVADLKDESDESREHREARQAHAEARGLKGHHVTATEARALGGERRQRQLREAKRTAARYDVPVADVLRELPEAHAMAMENWKAEEGAARELRRRSGLDAAAIGRVENAYRDHSTVPHFDELVDEAVAEMPELAHMQGWGHGEAAEAIWDIIKGGARRQPSPHDESVMDAAGRQAADRRRGKYRDAAPEPQDDAGRGDAWEPDPGASDSWEPDPWDAGDTSFDPEKFSRRVIGDRR